MLTHESWPHRIAVARESYTLRRFRPARHVFVSVGSLNPKIIFTARRFASAAYDVAVCPSVCPSVRLSQAGIVSKWLDESSWFFWHRGFLPPISYCALRKFGYLQKLGYSPLALVPNSGLRKFHHGTSIAFSTKLVVVVDGRSCWRHLYDNRRVVAVY